MCQVNANHISNIIIALSACHGWSWQLPLTRQHQLLSI
jgi:hypothetical protein